MALFFFDQVKEWALLFPAEQDYFERLFGLLDRTDRAAVEELFAPLRRLEPVMGVNERVWPKRQFTLDQVDFLNRNAHYAEWRKAVADIFARLDPVLDEEIARKGRQRLVVALSPAELPVGPDRMWTRLKGRRVFAGWIGANCDTFPQPGRSIRGEESALAVRHRPGRRAMVQRSLHGPVAGAVNVSYARLAAYRAQLMQEVNRLVRAEQIRGPRQLGAKLKNLKLMAPQGEVGADPVLSEFVRTVLLAGNGTLLINNTFAEWATLQAVRRARPSLTLISLGIRNKVKPFSSLLIYSDQETASPVPTQMDALGSYVDLEVFLDTASYCPLVHENCSNSVGG